MRDLSHAAWVNSRTN